MSYKIDYDAEFWDVLGDNKRFTCYSETDARRLCELLNTENKIMEQDYSFYYAKMAEDFHETEWMRQMFIVFNGLKGELKKDGNQWCATCGEWPEHNVSGFGDTPQQAMNNWYIEYYNPKLSVEQKDKRSVASKDQSK